MTQFKDYTPAGVIPAAILAFDEDFAINEAETRRHLSFVAATDGISAVTVNGHSSEIHACSFDEQRAILDVSKDELLKRLRSRNAALPPDTFSVTESQLETWWNWFEPPTQDEL